MTRWWLDYWGVHCIPVFQDDSHYKLSCTLVFLQRTPLLLRVLNLWVWLWRKFCFCLPACEHVTAWCVTACYSKIAPIAQSKNSVGKEDYRKVGVNSKNDCDLFFNFHQYSVKPQDGSYGVFVKESSARCNLATPSSCSSSPKVRLICFVSSSLLALCYFMKLTTGFYC